VTLDTRVAIGAPTDVRELFAFCQRLVDTPSGVDAQVNERSIGNPPGIGADAWLIVYHGGDGPLPVHEHDKWCATELGGEWNHTQEDIDEHASVANDPTENGWAVIEVSFDTAYGYKGPSGESCSDLHARIVTALGQWLDAKGLPWKWKNEYSGEWFDRFDQLDQFGDAHRATGADDWFRGQVLPLIEGGVL
jgi:hypothetical protein